MTTRKLTTRKRRPASSKTRFINYTPGLQYKDESKHSHPVPYVIYGASPREPHYIYYLEDDAHFGHLRDRDGRRVNEFDFIDKDLPRHYEVSVPKATYDRAQKKIDKIAALRDEADRIRGYTGMDAPFNIREASYEVMADLARRTRMRKRKSGKTSLRR